MTETNIRGLASFHAWGDPVIMKLVYTHSSPALLAGSMTVQPYDYQKYPGSTVDNTTLLIPRLNPGDWVTLEFLRQTEYLDDLSCSFQSDGDSASSVVDLTKEKLAPYHREPPT